MFSLDKARHAPKEYPATNDTLFALLFGMTTCLPTQV